MSDCPCSRSTLRTMEARSDAQTSRRGFFGAFCAGVLAVAAWPRRLFADGKPWVAVPLDLAPKLQKVGGSMTSKIRGKDLLLVRDGETSAHAFEALCPHEQCPVVYSAETQKVECPCHAAVFDLAGKVLEGPPPRPLETYAAIVDGGRILIKIPS
jgi:nitrite reductase/ring-hydroxylating ferredoxin subunit